MQFGIPGYDDLVWDVSRIGSSAQHGLNGTLQLGDYLNTPASSKIRRYRNGYAAKNIAFAPAILSLAGKIHPEFLRLLWVMADMQTVKYFNLVGDEEDIRVSPLHRAIYSSLKAIWCSEIKGIRARGHRRAWMPPPFCE